MASTTTIEKTEKTEPKTEKTEKAIDIANYVVRTNTGAIDTQGSHAKFARDVASLVQSERMDNEVIGLAVAKAFKDQKVSTLGMNAILHYSMENLEVDPGNFNAVRERVANYVRSNTRDFKVSKGKGGGVQWLQHAAAPSAAPPSSGSIRPSSRLTSPLTSS